MPRAPDRLIAEAEAANILGIAVRTLQKRVHQVGFRVKSAAADGKLGRGRKRLYRLSEVEAYRDGGPDAVARLKAA